MRPTVTVSQYDHHNAIPPSSACWHRGVAWAPSTGCRRTACRLGPSRLHNCKNRGPAKRIIKMPRDWLDGWSRCTKNGGVFSQGGINRPPANTLRVVAALPTIRKPTSVGVQEQTTPEKRTRRTPRRMRLRALKFSNQEGCRARNCIDPNLRVLDRARLYENDSKNRSQAARHGRRT